MQKLWIYMLMFWMAWNTTLASPPANTYHQALLDKPTTMETQHQMERLEEPSRDIPFDTFFERQIEQWIHVLSQHDTFASWREASWESYPLGPGLHGWIIILTQDGKEVGYLVVHSTPDHHLQLTEYGVGEYPLFSSQTLHRTLMQHGLITNDHGSYDEWSIGRSLSYERWYFNAFQAIWKVSDGEKTVFFDAVTGEAYPLEPEHYRHLLDVVEQPTARYVRSTKIASEYHLNEPVLLPAFDPFDQLNWIQQNPLSIEESEELKQIIRPDQPRVTYTALIFNDFILVPLAVTGYHQWEDEVLYMSIDQSGSRFIASHIVLQQGQFYLRKK